jgi:hypothetical protein
MGKVRTALTRAHCGAVNTFPGMDTNRDVNVIMKVTQTPNRVIMMHASVTLTPTQPEPQ